jgi:hypothetical protein
VTGYKGQSGVRGQVTGNRRDGLNAEGAERREGAEGE